MNKIAQKNSSIKRGYLPNFHNRDKEFFKHHDGGDEMKPCLLNVGQNGHEEELELFRRALVEALERHWQDELATGDPMPKEPSLHHKETMNRIFCEEVGGSFQPYPGEK